jgi:hypothetical protein
MPRASVTIAVTAITILISPAVSLAQSTGGSSAGTNSAGTAQSSGAGVNTGAGVTTGSAGSLGTGTAAPPNKSTEAAISEENKTIDRKLKGICRGC